MTLIDATYFDGPLLLPGVNEASVAAAIDMAIAMYEPEYLSKVLGPSLYAAFKEGIAVDADDQEDRWKWLRDGTTFQIGTKYYSWPGLKNTVKRSPIANYVYWQYRAENATQTTSLGETLPKSENAIAVSPCRKMVRAWNQMVDWNRVLLQLTGYLLDGDLLNLYPELVRCELDNDLFYYQNIFNI